MKKKEELVKVAIYTRVSTTEQAREGYSLGAQEKILREYCNLRKYQIVDVYSDKGLSGKDVEHRPQMKRLLLDAKAKKFNIILVWKLTRFTRRLSDLTKICEDLEKWDIYLVSYSENFDCSTPAGKMIRNMLGTIAQFEREVIGENVKLGMEARAEKGKRTCNAILGYDVDGDSFSINEKEAKHVKDIFNLYLMYKSIAEVTEVCKKKGYKGKRGKYLTSNTVLVILTNPTYCGYNRYCGKIYKGLHQPIIDVEIFNKVQILLKKQGRGKERPRIKE